MKILHHSSKNAVLDLSQTELLLNMALIQAGRDSLSCNSDAGKALDQLFVSANILVEEARRKAMKKTTPEPGVNIVAAWFRENSP